MSESSKQLKELEKQQAQDRQYAGPAVTDYGKEVGGMVMPMSHAQKTREIMDSLKTPTEHAEFRRRRAMGYGSTK